MENSISFDTPDKTFAQYGLLQNPIVLNGELTDYKLITRNSDLVSIVKRGYRLFPNEEAIKIADQAAKLVGLRQFATEVPGLKTDNHVIYSHDEFKMRALYTIEGQHKVDGEAVNVGVNVYNSINGTSSFGAGLFTFREMCSNGVIMGKHDIRSIRHAHTKGLDIIVDDLKKTMVLLMEDAIQLVERYREMASERITDKLVDKILGSRLSKKALPYYITEEEATPPKITTWELYNDITELIWHNQKTGLKTKTFQFDTLHSIIPLRV